MRLRSRLESIPPGIYLERELNAGISEELHRSGPRHTPAGGKKQSAEPVQFDPSPEVEHRLVFRKAASRDRVQLSQEFNPVLRPDSGSQPQPQFVGTPLLQV